MVKGLSLEEKEKEIEKDIYKTIAKNVFDACFHMYYNSSIRNFDDIIHIAHIFFDCLEIESRSEIHGQLLSIRDGDIEDNLNSYLQEINERRHHTYSICFEPYLHYLLDVDKFLYILQVIDESVKLVGKDKMYFCTGGYLDNGPDHLLNYYCDLTYLCIKRVMTPSGVKWYMITREETRCLDDISCIWKPSSGFLRFIDNKGRWGFIEIFSKERYYMPNSYVYVGDLCENKAWFAIQDNKEDELACGLNYKFGYCNFKGEVLIDPKFSYAGDFHLEDGEAVATAIYIYEYGGCHEYDRSRRNSCGDSKPTGITALSGLIKINESGTHTKEYEDLFQKQKKAYQELLEKEDAENQRIQKLGRHSRRQRTFEDELNDDEVMYLISRGGGDLLGFGD